MRNVIASLLALAACALLLFSVAPARAADVQSVVSVVCEGAPVVSQTTTIANASADKVAALRKSGQAMLDIASRNQDKGGPCTMHLQWGNEAAFELPGMHLAGVNQALRQGLRWLGTLLDDSERAEKSGKRHPWKEDGERGKGGGKQ